MLYTSLITTGLSSLARTRVNDYQNYDVMKAFQRLIDNLIDIVPKDLSSDIFRRIQTECVQYVRLVAGDSFSTKLNSICELKEFILELHSLSPICDWINIRVLEKISNRVDIVKEELEQYKEEIFDRNFDVQNITVYDVHEPFIMIEET